MKSLLLVLTVAVAGLAARAETTPDQLAAIRASCIKCHTSNSTTMPRMDGQTEAYLIQSTKDYLTKVRHSPAAVAMMFNRVKTLDDATIAALSNYFAGLPASPSIPGDAALIAKGAELYNNVIPGTTFKTCAACHGANGEGNGENNPLNPRVSGQIKSFLKVQMANYKNGLIDNQPEMKAISEALTDEQVAALVEFMASK